MLVRRITGARLSRGTWSAHLRDDHPRFPDRGVCRHGLLSLTIDLESW